MLIVIIWFLYLHVSLAPYPKTLIRDGQNLPASDKIRYVLYFYFGTGILNIFDLWSYHHKHNGSGLHKIISLKNYKTITLKYIEYDYT